MVFVKVWCLCGCGDCEDVVVVVKMWWLCGCGGCEGVMVVRV